MIAIIAMGQASFAAKILNDLLPAKPVFSKKALCREAKILLTVQNTPASGSPRKGYPRVQRDGFIFQAISWLAAAQDIGANGVIRPPHPSATSQGLDGLTLRIAADKSRILETIVFEDKCTAAPRRTFKREVIPAFLDRHTNRRSAEMVATASALLQQFGVDATRATAMAAAVMNKKRRTFRAAFALTTAHDNQASRGKLFKGYKDLRGLKQKQRIGAGFIVDGDLREWFKDIAKLSRGHLDAFSKKV